MATYDTKKQISDAYVRILKTKAGDKITVKDLFTECGISRQTFYYHFRDIMDVVEYTLRGILSDVVRDCKKIDVPREAIHLVLETVLENRGLIRRLESTSRSKEVEKIVADALHDSMAQILDSHDAEYRNLRQSDRAVLLDFTAYGVLGIVLTRLNDPDLDIDILTDQLLHIYSGEWKLL